MWNVSKYPGSVEEGTKLWFGRHQGETVEDVLVTDPTYLDWCLDEVEGFAEKVGEDLQSTIREAAASARTHEDW